MEDRLTSLPESLQLRILSTLDAKYVVQTSILSKSWFPLWKSVPILRLNSYDFENRFSKFDKFVEKALSSQREMDLDTLIYKRDKVSRAMILKKVIDYAFSHNVKHLDFWVDGVEGREWPIVLHGFVDSLISLRLQSVRIMFPKLKTCNGLPNLDSVVVAFAACSKRYDEKRMFDDLMMFFSKVYSVKSLKVCKGIVRILSMFQEELVSRCPPLRDIKFEVEDFDRRASESIMRTTEYLEFISDMKGYLLRVTHCER
ncbi:putative F-box/LRR-repeat protein [Tanacetum coccineum]